MATRSLPVMMPRTLPLLAGDQDRTDLLLGQPPGHLLGALLGPAALHRRDHDFRQPLFEGVGLHLGQRLLAVVVDDLRIEFTHPGENHAREVGADLGVVALQAAEDFLGDQVADRRFQGPGPAGVGFAGEDRRAAEELPLLAVIDGHIAAAGSLHADFHQPLLDQVEEAGGRGVLLEEEGAGRKTGQLRGGVQFLEQGIGQGVERFGIAEMSDQAHGRWRGIPAA